MKKNRPLKRCLGCKNWYAPDPRTQERQRFCSKAKCKKTSKAWRQAKWSAKNPNHWRGPDEVKRVQEWRAKHPGYWRRQSWGQKRVRYKTT